jgi:hypothetical protein
MWCHIYLIQKQMKMDIANKILFCNARLRC